MDEEKTWVRQALAGDQEAFACLVEVYKAPVFNLAYRLLGDQLEAEDAAQETFVRVYSRLNTYDPTHKLSSWIFSIASHYCVDRLRKRRFGWMSLEDLASWQVPSDPQDGPEKTALHREERDTLQVLLQQLPAHYRLVIVLRYWQDLSYEEMADVLHTTESTIKSRLHRARCMLAEWIKDQESQTGPSESGRRSMRPTPRAAEAIRLMPLSAGYLA